MKGAQIPGAGGGALASQEEGGLEGGLTHPVVAQMTRACVRACVTRACVRDCNGAEGLVADGHCECVFFGPF